MCFLGVDKISEENELDETEKQHDNSRCSFDSVVKPFSTLKDQERLLDASLIWTSFVMQNQKNKGKKFLLNFFQVSRNKNWSMFH